jgi:hypothetical protein
MQAPSGQMTGPALRALLEDGALAGEWVLDPRRSSIRLKSKVMGLVRVNGVFREVSGHGTVSADGEVSGALTVAAASIDTGNTRRDTHLRSADIFDSGSHPHITFTPGGIRPSGQGAAVTGAPMMRDYDRFASLFTPDGAVRIPDISAELARREEALRRDRVDAGSLRLLRANQDRRAGHQAAAARARATSPPATAASAVPAVDRFDLRQPQRPRRLEHCGARTLRGVFTRAARRLLALEACI